MKVFHIVANYWINQPCYVYIEHKMIHHIVTILCLCIRSIHNLSAYLQPFELEIHPFSPIIKSHTILFSSKVEYFESVWPRTSSI
ncbi:hypothetical protein D3C76_1710600 [compost metagenome]